MLKKLLELPLDILFPITCIHCEKGNKHICKKCIKEFTQWKNSCPLCNTKQKNKTLCKKCKTDSPFSEIIIFWDYSDKKVQKTIGYLKYRYIKDIGKIVTHDYREYLTIPKNTIVTPTPLHPRRLRERGFNQSAIIARELCKITGTSYQETLIRKKYTKPQARLSRSHRIKNISGKIKHHKNTMNIEGKTIVLVDDVLTTGTTLLECAKTLKKQNPKQIIGLCLAKNQKIDNDT